MYAYAYVYVYAYVNLIIALGLYGNSDFKCKNECIKKSFIIFHHLVEDIIEKLNLMEGMVGYQEEYRRLHAPQH